MAKGMEAQEMGTSRGQQERLQTQDWSFTLQAFCQPRLRLPRL